MPISQLPDVSSRYGAPMGRPTQSGFRNRNGDWVECAVLNGAAPFYLVRIPLNSGGYDSGGAYWGLGAPLYRFEYSRLSDISGFVRGRTRDAAKAAVREIHPNARFFK